MTGRKKREIEVRCRCGKQHRATPQKLVGMGWRKRDRGQQILSWTWHDGTRADWACDYCERASSKIEG